MAISRYSEMKNYKRQALQITNYKLQPCLFKFMVPHIISMPHESQLENFNLSRLLVKFIA